LNFGLFVLESGHTNQKNMTDKELYELCKKFGKETLEARQRFAGLLPEVSKRRLFEKKGFFSIYHFAAKLAGMSHDQVDIVLNLERKFEDKPVLQKALVSGEISVNKLVRIVSIATVENQEELFEKAKILSNRAVEVFVKDVKRWNENCGGNVYGKNGENQNQIGSNKPLFDSKSLHVQTLKLDCDIEKELTEIQEKGIDINAFLRKILQKRKEEIEQEKTRLANEQLQRKQQEPIGRQSRVTCHSRSNRESIAGMTVSKTIKITRYIPAKIRKIIAEEHGTKCSFPGCPKPAKTLHHTARFALTQNHDPRYLAPLCEAHHEIAHKIDLKYSKNWEAVRK
jgi:hypothetical protein